MRTSHLDPTTTHRLVGKKVVRVRAMTHAEMEREGWDLTVHGPPTVLEFDDGSQVFPSRDPEGNGGGSLFGVEPNGSMVRIHG